MAKSTYYEQRRFLRALEKLWARLEGLVNRITTARPSDSGLRVTFNPIYVVDTLGIFLLIVLLVTGIYLTIVYRPGADRAYASLEIISGSWLGSIMRSAHRYASDGLILVMLIHLLKMLFSDRFWGARWLAWVSGIVILLLCLVIGVMGYFLIWDQQAQWLAEYFTAFLKGPIWITFSSPQTVNDAFGFFVIILFLHVFLSLLIVAGMVVHEMRLQRPRVWSPRWVMIGAGVALVALSIWRPVISGPPADVMRLVTNTQLDVLYVGFLPLSRTSSGSIVWAISGIVIVVLGAFPWLLRGKHPGPAYVIEPDCTGCAICARECPYNAIDIVHREDDSVHDFIAVIKPNLCTGCGLCVADCPTAAIELELPQLATHQIAANLKETVAHVAADGQAPVAVFACHRHISLGTLKHRGENGEQVLMINQPVSVADPAVVSCAMPCAGMVQSEWLRDALKAGAEDVVVLSCPGSDCDYREGPEWGAARLARKRNQVEMGDRLHQLDIAPGDKPAFHAALRQMKENRRSKATARRTWLPIEKPALISLSAGLILLSLTLSLSLLAVIPVGTPSDQGALRIALDHTAQIKTISGTVNLEELQGRLPEGVDAAEVIGGERFPVEVRVEIDHQIVGEWAYEPRGLSREGAAYGLEDIPLDPGVYDISVYLMDDGETWQNAYTGTIEIVKEHVRILTFNPNLGAFVLD